MWETWVISPQPMMPIRTLICVEDIIYIKGMETIGQISRLPYSHLPEVKCSHLVINMSIEFRCDLQTDGSWHVIRVHSFFLVVLLR